MAHIADNKPTDQTPAENVAVNIPAGTPPLDSIYLYVSAGCNLACRHCWITPTFDAEGAKAQNIKLEYVQKAIEDARPLGLSSIKLTGGEPTIHHQFRDLVSLIHNAGLTSWMETNGMLIDAELAEFIVENGMWAVSISLDGATAATHEWMRQVKGSFDRAINGIKALVSAGHSPQVICTVHRGNVGELEELVALVKELGCSSLKINIPQKVGRGIQFADQQGFEVTEILDRFHWMHNDLTQKYGLPIVFDVPHAFYSVQELATSQLGTCGIRTIVGLLADGHVAMCGIGTSVPDLVYGHIENESLFDIWCHNPRLKQLREDVPYQLQGVCGNCIHQFRCLGKCVANNYFATGSLNAAHYFCQAAFDQGLFPASRLRV